MSIIDRVKQWYGQSKLWQEWSKMKHHQDYEAIDGNYSERAEALQHDYVVVEFNENDELWSHGLDSEEETIDLLIDERCKYSTDATAYHFSDGIWQVGKKVRKGKEIILQWAEWDGN